MSASGGNATPLAERNGSQNVKKSQGTASGTGRAGAMRERMQDRKVQAKEVSKEVGSGSGIAI